MIESAKCRCQLGRPHAPRTRYFQRRLHRSDSLVVWDRSTHLIQIPAHTVPAAAYSLPRQQFWHGLLQAGLAHVLEQLIARIDDESRRLLGETIETVRGHFRELFERLFGGGQADIVLDPNMDLLETTVEIVARPPGKEPRSISLLSGGEKTMTCVALLLAIFRSRPSPFCVLDEVDAALDESNVDRFVSVLRDFLSSTQFIVVTHSKKTMATATTLYGVTMEESGVSKRVSVRFESTAAAAPITRSAAA